MPRRVRTARARSSLLAVLIVLIIHHHLKKQTKKNQRFEPEQIAVAPLLESAPQCGIEDKTVPKKKQTMIDGGTC